MTAREVWLAVLLAAAMAALLLAIIAIFATPEPPLYRLVGYGCDGVSGPLYAQEEDAFPRCDSIEENTK